MDETRAIARLPHSEIEIRHRRLPEEQAEQLAISLSATPLFEAFAQFLERQAPWPWLALQPWLALAQMVQVTSQPWFAASSARAPGRRVTRRPTTESAGPRAASGPPKPGSFAYAPDYAVDSEASLGFVRHSRATPRRRVNRQAPGLAGPRAPGRASPMQLDRWLIPPGLPVLALMIGSAAGWLTGRGVNGVLTRVI